MLRVKVPAGQLPPQQLRAIGEVSNLYGKGDGELSTRQNIQLHWLELAKLPDDLRAPRGERRHDRRRLRRHRPQHHRLPRPGHRRRRALRRHADRRRGRRPLLRQPRLGQPAAQAQVLDLRLRRPLQRARDQLHLADRHRHRRRPRGLRRARRRRPLVGAADRAATWASSSRRRTRTRSSARSRSVWSEDLKYRVSRVKARLKFMVDDIGPEGDPRARRGEARQEARGLRAAADHGRALAPPRRAPAEAGGALLHRRARAPRPDLGRPDDRDRRPRRALRRRHPADAPAELHRHRHPERVDRRGQAPSSSAIGFPLDINPVRGNSIACTGEPHCNFSVAETKTRLGALIDHLDERFGDADRRACGCTSTAARTPAPSTGSATSASRARPRATRAASSGRPTTSSSAAGSAPSPRSDARSSGASRPTSSTRRSRD